MVEEEIELKSSGYAYSFCSSAVPVIDCEGRYPRSPIEIIPRYPLLPKESPVHGRGTTPTPSVAQFNPQAPLAYASGLGAIHKVRQANFDQF